MKSRWLGAPALVVLLAGCGGGKIYKIHSGSMGVAGDSIAIVGGRVIRNGQREAEAYARACDDPACNFPRAITISPAEYFLLGDKPTAAPLTTAGSTGRYHAPGSSGQCA